MDSQPERNPSAGVIRTWVLARILDTWPPDYYGEDLDALVKDCMSGASFDDITDAHAEIQRIVDNRHALEKSELRRQIKSPEFLTKLQRVSYAEAGDWPRLVKKYGRKSLAQDVAQDVLLVLLQKTRDQEPIKKLEAFAYACIHGCLRTMNRDLRDDGAELDAVLESPAAPLDRAASPEQRVADASVPVSLLNLAKAEIDSLKEVRAEYRTTKRCYSIDDGQRALMKEAFRRAVCHGWSGNSVWESFTKEETSGVLTRTQFFEIFGVVTDNILEPWKRTWRVK